MARVMALTVFGESMTTTATPGTDARRWTRTDIDARPASEETGGFMMKRVTHSPLKNNKRCLRFTFTGRWVTTQDIAPYKSHGPLMATTRRCRAAGNSTRFLGGDDKARRGALERRHLEPRGLEPASAWSLAASHA